MRNTQWMFVLSLAVSLYAAPAMAAEAAIQAPAGTLETIDAAPAAGMQKECPTHQGQKQCDHKKGDACPLHQNDKHHGKSHDKCDYKKQG